MATQEQKKDYHTTKDFDGVNTKANRTSIKETEFAWLENAMPIGHGNLKSVPAATTVAGVTFGSTVYYAQYGNIGTTNYYLAFQTDGRCEAINVGTSAKVTVGAASTFSSSGVQASQWNNTVIIIIDPTNGYFQWDGTNLVKVGSLTFTLSGTGTGYTTATATVAVPNQTGGTRAVISLTTNGTSITSVSAYGTGLTTGTGYTTVPAVTITSAGSGQTITAALVSQPGTCIASFSGRVWIANGRTLYYTAAGTNNDFYSASAGNIIFNDSTLIGNITQLVSANNFLYIFGVDSINVISDVRINTTTGSTLYTNTNISASVGSDLPYAMMPYFRSIVFMNRYGVYALVGSTTSKISDALDGLFPYIDFTKTVSAGQVLIYNILCASFNFYYNGTSGTQGAAQYIQAVFFDKKWFFTYQGAVKYIVSIPVSGSATIYSTTGSDLQTMYQSASTAQATKIQSALLGMGNIIRDKVALKFGVEAILSQAIGNNITITIDSENTTSPSVTLNNFQTVQWKNNSGAVVSWINNSLATVLWGNYQLGYYLYKYDAQMWGKYIGMTITSTSPTYIVSGLQYETEQRAKF
jgi:hypothetical protein